MLVELTANGYRNLGEAHEHARQELLARILSWVEANPLKNHEEVASALGLPKQLIKDHLVRLVAANVLAANGSGSRFDHHKFYRV
jgi:predicted ArsR family transcriptional regulator